MPISRTKDTDDALQLQALSDRLMCQLNQIMDPCSIATALPAGLVDMGLVRSLEIEHSANGALHAQVKICITHPFCMMAAVFLHEVEKRLRQFPQIETFNVRLDESAMWTEEFMSDEYRKRLKVHRAEKAHG
jgi:metal-sulfur cluster biosynthetic enzyme